MRCTRRVLVALALVAILAMGGAQAKKDEPSTKSSACCDELAALGWNGTLPVVIFRTNATAVTAEAREFGEFCTCSWGAANATDYKGYAKTKVRGNSSARLDKTPYSVRLAFENGTTMTDGRLWSWPKGEDWSFYATENLDLSEGMRNWIAYNAARATGEYASRTKYVELFLATNGEPLSLDHYNGLYLSLERIHRDRLGLKKLKADDPSGPMIFRFENDNWDSSDLTTKVIPGFENPFLVVYPDGKTKGPATAEWLGNYLTEFQAAIDSPDWIVETAPYINRTSWIDYFLLVELTKNPDGYRGSTYFSKEKQGPMNAGPAWDYNEAFGECCGFPVVGYDDNGKSAPGTAGGSAISPNGWRFLICADPERCLFDPEDGISRWFMRLWNDTDFRVAANARYAELRAGPWADEFFEAMFVDVPDEIEPAVKRDFERWDSFLLKDWYADGATQFSTEVSYLREWVFNRLSWMQEALEIAASPEYVYPGTDFAWTAVEA